MQRLLVPFEVEGALGEGADLVSELVIPVPLQAGILHPRERRFETQVLPDPGYAAHDCPVLYLLRVVLLPLLVPEYVEGLVPDEVVSSLSVTSLAHAEV